MNLEHLQQNYPKLLNYLKDKGYSGEAYYCTKTTIELILNTNDPSWKDYENVRLSLHKIFPAENAWARRTAALNRIICFDLFDEFPNWRRHPQLDKLNDYYQLLPDYKKLIDLYRSELSHTSLAESTIYRRCITVSSILLKLQKNQIYSLSEIDEDDIVWLYWNNGNPFGKTYREVFKDFLKRCSTLPQQLRKQISAYVPKCKKAIKNKQYLNEAEAEAVRAVLRSETQLSLRDRAIGSLLFYAGLRAVDISNLKGMYEKMSQTAVRKMLRQYAEEAHKNCSDCPTDLHPHQMRHSKATHLLGDGLSDVVVAEFLGHSGLHTIQDYVDVSMEQKRKSIDTLKDDHDRQTAKKWKDTDKISIRTVARTKK